MVESEIDEYKLDTNQGKKDQTLRISIVTDRICMLISNPKDLRERYINLITLEQLRDVCPVFDKIQTISEAVAILKNAIENNHILYSEDEESGNVEIKFNISQGQKSYPPFVIPLPYDSDEEDKQNVETVQIEDENQTENETPHENDIEVLPTKYDYQGNKEAEAKYGKSDKSTVDYAEPIIQSKVKEANVILEYIEPILQVHYPDGTTKSTPLPPRIQTADGKKPNIDPEQLKSIHEQMTRSFSQAIEEFEKERNRANSVAHKNTKNNINSSRQTVNVNNIGNSMNILKTENNNNISYENNLTMKNGVRNASNQGNNNLNNTVNIASIRQVRTAFNQNDDNNNNNQKGVNNNNLPNGMTSPRQNYANYRTQINGKENSNFSTNSLPNKPLDVHDFNYGGIQNGNINYNSGVQNNMNLTSNYMQYTQNPQPIIHEVPKMPNQSQNTTININQNFYQRGLNKSSSTPNMAALDKNSHNYLQKSQQQFQQQNNLQRSLNQSFFQNQINNVSFTNPANQQNIIGNVSNMQMNNSQVLFNQSRSPNANQTLQYQNKSQIFNKINMDPIRFQTQNNNMLNRHNSGQSPIISQNYLSQQQQQRLLQQQYNQQRFQMEQQKRMEQKKIMQEQQRLKEQKRLQEKQLVQKKIQEQQQRLMQIAQQRKQIFNMLAQFPQRQGKNNPGSRNIDQGFAEVNSLPKRSLNTTNGVNSGLNSQHSQPINPNLSLNQTQQMQRNIQNSQFPSYTLKQSQSQQIIKQKPSIKAPEITQQQIALAQMASLQNLQNPNMSSSQAIPLQKRFLDSEGNEETQSQYEREEENVYKDGKGTEKATPTPQSKTSENLQRQESTQEQDDDIDSEAENLYRTETGLIIFRNGLLHGIIHKYAEVDDIVSKIQLKLKAGVKFMLLYSASRDGDKAKTFHSKCDSQKMSLVLVETTKGVRFGGFTMKDWGGKCVKKIDNEAFVFNLDTRKCFDVIKNEFAIGGYPKFGPVFFGCQIRIYDDFFKKGGTTCHRTLNYNTKKDYELNNGEQNYIVKEIEVYGIETIDV